MRKRAVAVAGIVAAVLFITACNRPENPPADAILIHGRVYTVNAKQPWAQAVAMRKGKIVAVGSDAAIAAYQGPATRVIDAAGHMVLPGFIDAHVHMTAGA